MLLTSPDIYLSVLLLLLLLLFLPANSNDRSTLEDALLGNGGEPQQLQITANTINYHITALPTFAISTEEHVAPQTA